MRRLWPRSLTGQLLLWVALALLFAQAVSAALLYRAEAGHREAMLVNAAAFRLLRAARGDEEQGGRGRWERRSFSLERSAQSPLRRGEARDHRAEAELTHILAEQEFAAGGIVVVRRSVASDSLARERMARQAELLGSRHRRSPQDRLLIAAVRPAGESEWLVARVFVPPGERALVMTLIGQTVLIYLVLVGAIALLMRRITRPLAALTGRLARFADTRDPLGQIAPEGPDDLRRLIEAQNAMEARIAALIDEKDVMLGAIGHDLKTPLAALRVRIESVEDEGERARMAATIEDIVRSLDDILALARVGRPRDAGEPTELSALVASVAEEYEDMGEPVTFAEAERIVLPLRATWLRRALRNLIGNALRYGKAARVTLAREAGMATIRIDDDGPGIPDEQIERMFAPFVRGEPSRNTETGGAGLGLALARAIAEQHGGSLALANRRGAGGQVEGLTALLRLPLSV